MQPSRSAPYLVQERSLADQHEHDRRSLLGQLRGGFQQVHVALDRVEARDVSDQEITLADAQPVPPPVCGTGKGVVIGVDPVANDVAFAEPSRANQQPREIVGDRCDARHRPGRTGQPARAAAALA